MAIQGNKTPKHRKTSAILSVLSLVFITDAVALANNITSVAPKASTQLVTSQHQGSELQLEVKQTPLIKVLREIERLTHIPIHYSVLPDGLISATCVGSSLKPVLDCLLNHKADIIVRYANENPSAHHTDQIAEAWILGAKLEAVSNAAACAITSETGSVKLNQADLSEDEPIDTVDAKKTELVNSLLKIAQSKNPTERADAIGSLLAIGSKNDPKIKAVLEEGLHDKDANVRAQALSTLAHLEGGERATQAIEEALQDSSTDVRIMAVDSISDNVDLLHQAAHDVDEIVRTVANLKLDELRQHKSN